MKKIIAALVTICLIITACPLGLFSITASADTSGTTGKCTWSIVNTVLTISGEGAMGSGPLFNSDLAATITRVRIGNGVTSIGSYAFSDFTGLQYVEMANSVTKINTGAFYNCTSLYSFKLSDSLTYIGDNAFYNCNFLSSVSIPNTVTYIGSEAFRDCNTLQYINIPNGITAIKEHTFTYCQNLQDITLPDSVTSIEDNAFFGCGSLKKVTCLNGYVSIGEMSFYNCQLLTNVPKITSSIGSDAFLGCDSVTSVTLGKDVLNISAGAFAGSGIKDIVIEEGNENYCVENGVLYNKPKTAIIYYPSQKTDSTFSIFDSVATIEGSAFAYSDNLLSITIPNSVKTIGSSAFIGCNSLKNVFYRGNETNKNSISIGYNNSPLTSAVWYYNGCIGSSEHTYTNKCDDICNICDFKRIDTPHLYNNVCDAICNLCSEERIPPHSYDTTYDLECNLCRNIRVASGKTGDCCWSLNGTILTISGNGKMADYTNDSSDSLPWGKSITAVIVENGVTEIGVAAFKGCDQLTSINIPDSVTIIGDYAFSNCDSLTFINIHERIIKIGNGAFMRCSNLANITVDENNAYYCDIDGVLYNKNATALICYPNGKNEDSFDIPNGVTTICKRAFNSCTSIKTITIPESVTFIGSSDLFDSAFSSCTNLKTVNYNAINCNNPSYSVFPNCWITTINIGQNVKKIPEQVFQYLGSIKTVNYNAINCTSMGSSSGSVFSSCTGITTINIGQNVESIPAYAFWYCKSIKTVNYNAINCTIVGDVFSACTGITTINIGQNVKKIPSNAFAYCTSLTSITIPNSVTSIGYRAFYKCNSLTSVTIPDSVTSIDAYAFYDCASLESIIIPDSVTSIGNSAFYDCTNLKSITIPNSVITIGYDAFLWCNSLENVFYRGGITNKKNISIDSSNSDLIYATWHYNSCIGCSEHTYTNSCDAICDVCEFERIIEHTYTNSCDTVCDICKFERITKHSYTNSCDAICNVCEFERITSHTYVPRVTEPTCTEQGFTTYTCHCGDSYFAEFVSATGHKFHNEWLIEDTGHFHECLKCGAHSTPLEHYYSSVLDTDCDICGHTRNVHTPGDIDGVEGITDRDAVHLLYHTFLPSIYPVNQDCDFNGDGEVNDKDAVYLLYHTFLPDLYPID